MQDLRAEVILQPGERLSQAQYGSDLIVELFAALGLPYVALNPGSSYRGIHDSLVNFKLPGVPEMVVCLHEEIAVAVAHGYARVSGKPMLAATHDVVGLQHASMAIYNAWCDRIPVIVIGGTGPVASNNRRHHIDWVHTANVQGNLVRDFVKWDDQPSSLEAIPDSILRGYRIAVTEPSAPVYLCFDVELQEKAVETPLRLPDVARFRPPSPPAADPEGLDRAAAMLAGAAWPVILADAVGRHREALPALRELAELLNAPVVSIGGGFNIESTHPLNLTPILQEVLGRADVLLALDCFDLYGALGPGISPQRSELEYTKPDTAVIHISLWDLLQHSLTSDYERLHAVDLPITADTRTALPALVEQVRRALQRDSSSRRRIEERGREVERLRASVEARRRAAVEPSRPMSMSFVSSQLASAVGSAGVPWSFVYGSPQGAAWEVTEPEQVNRGGRGAGLGQAAPMAVGGALAHRGSGRLCISVIGDGDLLYTPSALWTASNLRLPLLTIVNNNRSYGNDEGHQEFMARQRGRPVENRGIGIFIENPEARFTDLARAFDVEAFGPVEEPAELLPVLEQAVRATLQGRPVLVDVRTQRRT